MRVEDEQIELCKLADAPHAAKVRLVRNIVLTGNSLVAVSNKMLHPLKARPSTMSSSIRHLACQDRKLVLWWRNIISIPSKLRNTRERQQSHILGYTWYSFTALSVYVTGFSIAEQTSKLLVDVCRAVSLVHQHK